MKRSRAMSSDPSAGSGRFFAARSRLLIAGSSTVVALLASINERLVLAGPPEPRHPPQIGVALDAVQLVDGRLGLDRSAGARARGLSGGDGWAGRCSHEGNPQTRHAVYC